MEPILVQIIGVGVNAFMTVKANVPANATLRTPKKEYNQKAVWTNEVVRSTPAPRSCTHRTARRSLRTPFRAASRSSSWA